jgi:hypothetical protein
MRILGFILLAVLCAANIVSFTPLFPFLLFVRRETYDNKTFKAHETTVTTPEGAGRYVQLESVQIRAVHSVLPFGVCDLSGGVQL